MTDSSGLFPDTYESSRRRFVADLSQIQKTYPGASLYHHPLAGEDDVSIDWISADAQTSKEKLFILTTGEHGIEGYTGSAMLQVFIEEYLPQFDPQTTGILLVHAINPWGMKYHRKVNRNNVDLNRNFVWDPSEFDPAYNPSAEKVKNLVFPDSKADHSLLHRLMFLDQTGHALVGFGKNTVVQGALMGQYRFPRGMYYGGSGWEEETRLMIDLYRENVSKYPRVLHLDMHTGYGPRWQMSQVTSQREGRASLTLRKDNAYPLIVRTDPAEFYAISGDMIDFMYRLIQTEFPDKHLYAATFEFGTYGDSLPAAFRSLRTMVFEAQDYQYGSKDDASHLAIRKDFDLLYDVRDNKWCEKALADARQAFSGVFKAEGLI